VDRYEGNEPPADRAPSAVDTKPHGAEMPPTITYHSRTPDWPQGMKRGTAAAYCDLSEQAFQAEVSRGRLPKPTKLGGENHWYRPSIDKALLDLFAPKEEWSDDDV
jgi:predicted DNA-binding transcriptional regulator AlpA